MSEMQAVHLPLIGRTVKLGAIPPKTPPKVVRLRAFLAAPVGKPAPDAISYADKARPALSRMYLNDQYGCCFPAGTLVHMADGTTRPIEHVRVTERVRTAEWNTGPVDKVMARYVEEPLVRVVAWGHSHLRMTHEHPVLTKRGYVKAAELTEGDWIALPKRLAGRRAAIQTADVLAGVELHGVKGEAGRRGYAASVAAQKKAVAVAVASLPETIRLTPTFGRLVGLFLAEGSVCRRVVSFTFSHDERDTLVRETVELFRTELNAEAELSDRPHAIEVRACGKVLGHLFTSLCGKGAAGKRLSPLLHDGPADFLRAVFDGWMDGDGHARRGSRVGVTVSHQLALDMFNIAQTLGLEPIIGTRQPSESRAPNGPNGELVKVSASRSWSVGVTDKRKADGVSESKTPGKWIAWGRTEDGRSKNLGTYATRDEAVRAATDHRTSAKSNVARVRSDEYTTWRRVRRVEREPFAGYVYNLEVTGDNSYVAEGIGVHNCVIAGKAHSFGVWSANDGADPVQFSDSEILKRYNQLKAGAGDSGCVISDVLDWLCKPGNGFVDLSGKAHAADGYVAVDTRNREEVKTALYLFGALTIGFNVTNAMVNSAREGAVWDKFNQFYVVGGHDVSVVGYDATGVKLSTWGVVLTMTWDVFTNPDCVTECYAPLAPDWYGSDKVNAATGLDADALKKALDSLKGGIVPPIPDPKPIDPPAPVVPPAPPAPALLTYDYMKVTKGLFGPSVEKGTITLTPAKHAAGFSWTNFSDLYEKARQVVDAADDLTAKYGEKVLGLIHACRLFVDSPSVTTALDVWHAVQGFTSHAPVNRADIPAGFGPGDVLAWLQVVEVLAQLIQEWRKPKVSEQLAA